MIPALLATLNTKGFIAAATVAINVAIFGVGAYVGQTWNDDRLAAATATIENYKKESQKQREKIVELSLKTKIEYQEKLVPLIHKEKVYVTQYKEIPLPDSGLAPNGWVYTHDNYVQGGTLDAARAADGTPSETGFNQALGFILSNYNTCEREFAKLESLQNWVLDYNEQVVDKSK